MHVVVEMSRKYLHSSHVPATHTLRLAYLVLYYWAESQPKLAPDKASVSAPTLQWTHGGDAVRRTPTYSSKLNADMDLIWLPHYATITV